MEPEKSCNEIIEKFSLKSIEIGAETEFFFVLNIHRDTAEDMIKEIAMTFDVPLHKVEMDLSMYVLPA